MNVHLKDVKIAFPALWEAKQVQGQGEAKFGAIFIFGKDHPQKAEFERAIVTAAKEKWGDAKYGEILKGLKAGDKLCMHDGDAKTQYQGFAGQLYVSASNKMRPLVIDGNRSPLTAADGKPYAGAFVNAIIEVWAQDNQFGKRINASLLGVQFLRDGERLAGGGVAAADDFEAIPGTTTAAAATDGAAALFS